MAAPRTLLGTARDPRRPRLLIARMSAIGDTILTTPVACLLRRRFPDAYLAWIVEEKSSCFVRDHPAIDEAIVMPRGWFADPKQVLSLRQTLRKLRFDAALDCQGLTKTALACWLTGAPIRVGFRGEHGRELSPWLNNRLIDPPRPHITDRSLDLLEALQVPAPAEEVEWDLPREEQIRERIDGWFRDPLAEVDANRFAVINPGASWDSKLWVNSRFADLAIGLRERYGLMSLVVWGGTRERGWAEEIVARSQGAAIMGPPTSLPELAELLRHARIVISPDTGPMHMAVAVGSPTVGLFGVTRPEDCGPYGWPHQAVQRRHQSGGRKQRRRADNDAMREITVEDALRACETVLDRSEDLSRQRVSA